MNYGSNIYDSSVGQQKLMRVAHDLALKYSYSSECIKCLKLYAL